ncbi:hypothetical protein [Halogeometricum sp. CBA1124]|jgi:hypothetical protein|uniref:hypothetical protein n=1 Tax=Halogeometricum sp. CBA1124 TaxID=2668071 RepID=UPI00142CEF7B|nr:hypothetical protein [Halogeometricum sp. CBA1124]MUV56446.1 hypothetical protein [Halogeometricum sp. CBA1124]
MERAELYNLLTLFLVSIVTLSADLSTFSFPMSLLSSVASVVAFLAVILIPAYLLADVVADAEDRLRS